MHVKLHDAVMLFINMLAKRIAGLYQKLVTRISAQMEKMTEKVKTSRLMNNFLLFKILREISENIKSETIETCTSSMFRFCQI